jgi:hypothetical protein
VSSDHVGESDGHGHAPVGTDHAVGPFSRFGPLGAHGFEGHAGPPRPTASGEASGDGEGDGHATPPRQAAQLAEPPLGQADRPDTLDVQRAGGQVDSPPDQRASIPVPVRHLRAVSRNRLSARPSRDRKRNRLRELAVFGQVSPHVAVGDRPSEATDGAPSIAGDGRWETSGAKRPVSGRLAPGLCATPPGRTARECRDCVRADGGIGRPEMAVGSATQVG